MEVLLKSALLYRCCSVNGLKSINFVNHEFVEWRILLKQFEIVARRYIWVKPPMGLFGVESNVRKKSTSEQCNHSFSSLVFVLKFNLLPFP